MARGLAARTVLGQLDRIPEFLFPWLPVGCDAAAGVFQRGAGTPNITGNVLGTDTYSRRAALEKHQHTCRNAALLGLYMC